MLCTLPLKSLWTVIFVSSIFVCNLFGPPNLDLFNIFPVESWIPDNACGPLGVSYRDATVTTLSSAGECKTACEGQSSCEQWVHSETHRLCLMTTNDCINVECDDCAVGLAYRSELLFWLLSAALQIAALRFLRSLSQGKSTRLDSNCFWALWWSGRILSR